MPDFPTSVVFRKSDIGIDIDAVEKHYNATFVGDFCLKDRNGQYVERTVAIFWQEKPPVEGYSHYFGLLVNMNGNLVITSGQSAFDKEITALVTPAGEVVYSRHRWDCRQAETAGFMIDGGRDYTRIVGDIGQSRWATLKIDGPTINIEYAP